MKNGFHYGAFGVGLIAYGVLLVSTRDFLPMGIVSSGWACSIALAFSLFAGEDRRIHPDSLSFASLIIGSVVVVVTGLSVISRVYGDATGLKGDFIRALPEIIGACASASVVFGTLLAVIGFSVFLASGSRKEIPIF